MKLYRRIALYLVLIPLNLFILGVIWFYYSGWYTGVKAVIPELFWYSGFVSVALIYINYHYRKLYFQILSGILFMMCAFVTLNGLFVR